MLIYVKPCRLLSLLAILNIYGIVASLIFLVFFVFLIFQQDICINTCCCYCLLFRTYNTVVVFGLSWFNVYLICLVCIFVYFLFFTRQFRLFLLHIFFTYDFHLTCSTWHLLLGILQRFTLYVLFCCSSWYS